MSDALKRIRKARQGTAEINGMKLLIRRPTDIEAAQIHREAWTLFKIACEFVYGWEGVRDCDLASNGAEELVTFDQELWVEWLSDQPEMWTPLGKAVMEIYYAHAKKRGDDEKN